MIRHTPGDQALSTHPAAAPEGIDSGLLVHPGHAGYSARSRLTLLSCYFCPRKRQDQTSRRPPRRHARPCGPSRGPPVGFMCGDRLCLRPRWNRQRPDVPAGSRTGESAMASDLSRWTSPAEAEVAAAIIHARRVFGGPRGCAGAVAAAFGEHPGTAVTRMRWPRNRSPQSVQPPCAWPKGRERDARWLIGRRPGDPRRKRREGGVGRTGRSVCPAGLVNLPQIPAEPRRCRRRQPKPGSRSNAAAG